MPDETVTDRIGTVTDCIGTVIGRNTDDIMPFVENRSLSEPIQSSIHIECSSAFPSQETGTGTFSSSRAKCKQFFIFSISLARVVFSLANLRNVFRLIASGVNTVASIRLLLSDLFRTYSQTWDRVANFSKSRRVFSCKPMRDLRESHYKTSHTYFRLPQSRLQASKKRT